MNALTRSLCPWLTGYLEELEHADDKGRLGHGWIFAGASGIGKLNLAMVFATRLLGGAPGRARPPGRLDPDSLVDALEARYQPYDHHPDMHLVSPEEGKRTIGVDRIRSMIEEVSLTGYAGGAKVVIIEPAESMTVQAANALLKSLEEPAGGTRLILVSHCPGRLPATIRSRCQTLAIRRPAPANVAGWLGTQASPQTQPLIAGESVGPVEAARRIRREDINKYKALDDSIVAVSQFREDPGVAAEACRNLDLALVLEWLAARVRSEIRRRATIAGSNSITEASVDLTENHWHSLATLRLHSILDDAGRLRDQLGSGVNEQLALEVLFASFALH